MKVGVAKETAPGERRVALVPEALGKLQAAGCEILVESGAGVGSAFLDNAYAEAGATVVPTDQLYAQSDVILKVAKPSAAEAGKLRSGQAVVGFLAPLIDPALAQDLAGKGVTAISLDAIPRTLSRAQSMDALSSQANVGGYKAVLIAANAYPRYFPLLTTAAGTAKPANVLILGIGVAGLQAIGTAKRLGAVVHAYDVRPETREQAESLGAKFVKLKTAIDATGAGGYARELTPEERADQQADQEDGIEGQQVFDLAEAEGEPRIDVDIVEGQHAQHRGEDGRPSPPARGESHHAEQVDHGDVDLRDVLAHRITDHRGDQHHAHGDEVAPPTGRLAWQFLRTDAGDGYHVGRIVWAREGTRLAPSRRLSLSGLLIG